MIYLFWKRNLFLFWKKNQLKCRCANVNKFKNHSMFRCVFIQGLTLSFNNDLVRMDVQKCSKIINYLRKTRNFLKKEFKWWTKLFSWLSSNVHRSVFVMSYFKSLQKFFWQLKVHLSHFFRVAIIPTKLSLKHRRK